MPMSPDQYVHSVLQRYAVNQGEARLAAKAIKPYVREWARSYLSDLTCSGSFAKGTGNNISTDIDLFISLRADTQATLQEVYSGLF